MNATASLTLKRFLKLMFFGLGLLGFIFALVLIVQFKALHDELRLQKNQLAMLEASSLQNKQNQIELQAKIDNLAALVDQLSDGRANLQQIQARSASIALSNLQTNLLQGQNKAILSNDLAVIYNLLIDLHQSTLTLLAQQLQLAIANLPNVNPEQALNQLAQLQQALATLTFITSAPAAGDSAKVSASKTQGLLSNIWQQIKSLIIVRSDNQISNQLVTDTARFDALRTLQLLIQEAKWQILTGQDPTNTLTQLKIAVLAYTDANAAQSAWLNQLNLVQTAANYYPSNAVQNIDTLVTKLQILLKAS